MSRRVLVLGIALSMLAAGCGGDDTVEVGPDDVAAAVTIGSDQTLEVRLEGNPTTGYTWEVAEAGIVSLVDRTHQPESDLAGAPGITTLMFEPTGTGSGDLILIYHRSWEEDVEPLETRIITVTVSG